MSKCTVTSERKGSGVRNRFRVTSIAIALAMAMMFIFSASLVTLPISTPAAAFPGVDPQPSEYIFYDDFETAGSILWPNFLQSTGVVTLSTEQTFHGLFSAKFDVYGRNGENLALQRYFSNNTDTRNEGIIVECQFYDNASVTRQDPEVHFRMTVGNDHATVMLGIKLNLTLGQRMYFFGAYDDGWPNAGYKYQVTGHQRTSGWHDLKIQLVSHTQFYFYVDNDFVGNLTLTSSSALTGMTYMSIYAPGTSGNPAEGQVWYVDKFLIYRFVQDRLWTERGVALDNDHVYNAWAAIEPTVLYEDGVYKMWYDSMATYGGDGAVGYATSTDALNWTDYGSTLVSMGIGYRPFVAHIGSVYYLYYTNEAGQYGDKHYMRRTSTDGLTWSAAVNTNLGCSPIEGTWNHKLIGNINVWKENTTWYAIYEGGSNTTLWTDALATSTDGLTWATYAGNPILPDGFTGGGPDVHKINGIYYMLVHGVLTSWVNNVPTDIYLLQSTDLMTWTNSSFFCQQTRELGYWGENYQIADASYYEGHGNETGRHFMMYEGTFNGTDAGRLYVAESDYSLDEIGRGEVLQWGFQFIGSVGLTNNVTANGTYWYSGMNAMKGTYFHDLNFTTTSDINIMVTARSATELNWSGDAGSGNPIVNFTFETGKQYTMGGSYFPNLTVATTSLVNIIVNSTSADESSWTGDLGSENQTISCALSGLDPGSIYTLYLDGEAFTTVISNLDGVVAFTYWGNGTHDFHIEFSDMQKMINMLWPIVSIAVIMIVLVGIVGLVFDAGKIGKGGKK